MARGNTASINSNLRFTLYSVMVSCAVVGAMAAMGLVPLFQTLYITDGGAGCDARSEVEPRHALTAGSDGLDVIRPFSTWRPVMP